MGEVGVLEGERPRDRDFTAYVQARQGSLIRFACFVSGDPDLSKDLVQTALLKAYLHWDRISHLDAPDAYIRKIIVNEHMSWWRPAWRRREVISSPLVAFSNPTALENHPHDAELWAQIVALSPMQRAIVVLRFYEDLTETQTADCLGCSIGTVKTHSSRAMERLRAKLKEAHA